jgi:hypothetical protein
VVRQNHQVAHHTPAPIPLPGTRSAPRPHPWRPEGRGVPHGHPNDVVDLPMIDESPGFPAGRLTGEEIL